MPASPNNSNRTRHGVRGWISIKRLAAGAGTIRRALYQERAEIEAAIVAQHGEVNLIRAALLQSALATSVLIESRMSLLDVRGRRSDKGPPAPRLGSALAGIHAESARSLRSEQGSILVTLCSQSISAPETGQSHVPDKRYCA